MAIEALGRTFGVQMGESAPAPLRPGAAPTGEAEIHITKLKFFGAIELSASDETLFVAAARCISLLSSYGGHAPLEAAVAVAQAQILVTLGPDTSLWHVHEVLLCSYHPDGWLVLVRQTSRALCQAFLFSQAPVLKVSFRAGLAAWVE